MGDHTDVERTLLRLPIHFCRQERGRKRMKRFCTLVSSLFVISIAWMPSAMAQLSPDKYEVIFNNKSRKLAETPAFSLYSAGGWGSDPMNGVCNSTTTVVVMLNQSPEVRITREILWNKYRQPVLDQVMKTYCTKRGSEYQFYPDIIRAIFYHRDLYFDRNLNPGISDDGRSLYIIPAAFANYPTAWYLEKIAGYKKSRPTVNTSLQTFVPMIYGYSGRGERGSGSHQAAFAYAWASSNAEVLAKVAAKYRDFPDKSFLESVAVARKERQIYLDGRRKEWAERDKRIWAAAPKWIAGASVAVNEQQCGERTRIGYSRPWWCNDRE